MIKLFKQMRRKEALMALLCAVLVVGQVWFRAAAAGLYDAADDAHQKTPGSTSGDIWNVGVQMLLVTLGSAVLSIGCGFWRRNAPRASALPCAKSCSIT